MSSLKSTAIALPPTARTRIAELGAGLLWAERSVWDKALDILAIEHILRAHGARGVTPGQIRRLTPATETAVFEWHKIAHHIVRPTLDDELAPYALHGIDLAAVTLAVLRKAARLGGTAQLDALAAGAKVAESGRLLPDAALRQRLRPTLLDIRNDVLSNLQRAQALAAVRAEFEQAGVRHTAGHIAALAGTRETEVEEATEIAAESQRLFPTAAAQKRALNFSWNELHTLAKPRMADERGLTLRFVDSAPAPERTVAHAVRRAVAAQSSGSPWQKHEAVAMVHASLRTAGEVAGADAVAKQLAQAAVRGATLRPDAVYGSFYVVTRTLAATGGALPPGLEALSDEALRSAVVADDAAERLRRLNIEIAFAALEQEHGPAHVAAARQEERIRRGASEMDVVLAVRELRRIGEATQQQPIDLLTTLAATAGTPLVRTKSTLLDDLKLGDALYEVIDMVALRHDLPVDALPIHRIGRKELRDLAALPKREREQAVLGRLAVLPPAPAPAYPAAPLPATLDALRALQEAKPGAWTAARATGAGLQALMNAGLPATAQQVGWALGMKQSATTEKLRIARAIHPDAVARVTAGDRDMDQLSEAILSGIADTVGVDAQAAAIEAALPGTRRGATHRGQAYQDIDARVAAMLAQASVATTEWEKLVELDRLEQSVREVCASRDVASTIAALTGRDVQTVTTDLRTVAELRPASDPAWAAPGIAVLRTTDWRAVAKAAPADRATAVLRIAACRVHNLDYFATIDSTAKAYWLGFLHADGYVRNDHRVVTLQLKAEDHSHVAAFGAIFGIPAHRSERTLTNKHTHESKQIPISSVTVCGTRLCADLVSKGFSPQKSHSQDTTVFENVPKALMSHFMRGLLDADGSVIPPAEYGGRLYAPRIKFLGTKAVAEKIADVLEDRLGLRRPVAAKDGDSDVVYNVVWDNAYEVARLAEWLYDPAPLVDSVAPSASPIPVVSDALRDDGVANGVEAPPMSPAAAAADRFVCLQRKLKRRALILPSASVPAQVRTRAAKTVVRAKIRQGR